MKAPLLRAKANTASCALSVSELRRYSDGWLVDSEYRQLAPQTLYARRVTMEKLLWWLDHKGYDSVSALEIKAFLAYISTGHTDKGGRWGNEQQTRKVRPSTPWSYHGRLRTFFRWMVEEGYAEVNLMEAVKPPISRPDQVQPFTHEQVASLLSAAKASQYPKRDEAIVLFLLDTGVRVSELCTLTISEVDVVGKKAVVLGKGNKHRTVYFGKATGRALWTYLKGRDEIPQDAPVFAAKGGEPFTRSGLLQLVERLGKVAGLEAVRCSPHTFRHTCAIEFLRAGGNLFALKEMLGHTSLGVTQRYVALAQADVANQHRQYSPVEAMRKGGRK